MPASGAKPEQHAAPAEFCGSLGSKRGLHIRFTPRSPRNSISRRCPIPRASCLQRGPRANYSIAICNGSTKLTRKFAPFRFASFPPTALIRSEPGLRAFIQRQLRKPDKTDVDRDKIDLLLVQYFALCAPEELCRDEINLEDVAKVLQPVLPEADATPLEWCEPLDEILEKLAQCHSLRDLMEDGLLEQGRLLKDSAGRMFYDPAALVAFCRFNFLLRRAFIRMLHADLSAVQDAIEALEANGVKIGRLPPRRFFGCGNHRPSSLLLR